MLGGVVLFVLLLACANIANLMLARGVGRAREIAVRAALGGTRWRMGRQLLAESAALGVLGGVAVWVSHRRCCGWRRRWFRHRPFRWGSCSRSTGESDLFALAVTLDDSTSVGLAPAWQAAHVSLVDAMSAGGRGSSDRAGRVRQGLAVLEIAVALLLMTGAGLLVRTLASLNRVDAGYGQRTSSRCRCGCRFAGWSRRGLASCRDIGSRSMKRLPRCPVSVSAALGSNVPLGGISYRQPFEVVGAPVADRANRPVAHFNVVSSQYFAALGIR